MPESSNSYDLILENALKVFVERGFAGARTQEIAEKAGVNKALIYYYVDSKQDLFHKAYQQALHILFGDLFSVLEDDTPLMLKIEIFINQLIDCLNHEPTLAAFIIEERNLSDKIPAAIIKDHFSCDLEILEKQLEKAASNYEIARINARQLLLYIFSLTLFPFTGTHFLKSMLDAESDDQWNHLMETHKGTVTDLVFNWLTT